MKIETEDNPSASSEPAPSLPRGFILFSILVAAAGRAGLSLDPASVRMRRSPYLVAKIDPVTFAADEIGWYAVHVNVNDVACCGATPRWFLATIPLPETSTTAEMAESIFAQIADACRELEVW